MADKQPSFAERCEMMHRAAEQLEEIAEFLELEGNRMAAAAKRFAERNAKRNTKASR